ncbi:hypothetical protein AVEN_26778-1 [Araneus ventricosus]|uniref:Uncharacterized protein n=1 Tax=Araneus ventricosus TaxID=182803 RepID=A0A4Y2D8F3_ARAVE|nr:hypothetical protein AVEN_26778-1 [Araneus ventricosus]
MGFAPDLPHELLKQFLSFANRMGIAMQEDDTVTQHARPFALNGFMMAHERVMGNENLNSLPFPSPLKAGWPIENSAETFKSKRTMIEENVQIFARSRIMGTTAIVTFPMDEFSVLFICGKVELLP